MLLSVGKSWSAISRKSYRDLQEQTLLRSFRPQRCERLRKRGIPSWRILGPGPSAIENFISPPPPKQVQVERNGFERARRVAGKEGEGGKHCREEDERTVVR